jgi:MFS transporter, ACS family, tartrate transporter
MRFIFGAAEAGFYPGIIIYLTYWFTADERARWLGVFATGGPLSLVIGAIWALVDGNGCSSSRACRLFS